MTDCEPILFTNKYSCVFGSCPRSVCVLVNICPIYLSILWWRIYTKHVMKKLLERFVSALVALKSYTPAAAGG